MNFDESLFMNFRYPSGAKAQQFAEAQIHLLKRDPDLWPYLYAIQKYLMPNSSGKSGVRKNSSSRSHTWKNKILSFFKHCFPRPTIHADVLICGVWRWQRPQEDVLLRSTIFSLLERGKSIVLIIHRESALIKIQHPKLKIVDPHDFPSRILKRLTVDPVSGKTNELFSLISDYLEEIGLTLGESAWEELNWILNREFEWSFWKNNITFRAAILRCHWLPLCSAIAQSAHSRGIKIAVFQQGLISHTIDFPLVADTVLCFGDVSAETFQNMDTVFSRESKFESHSPTYLPVGNLIDRLRPQTHAFERKHVLVLSQNNPWAIDYYALAELEKQLFDIVSQLTCIFGVSTTVRLHPANPDPEKWQSLVRKSKGICAISYPSKHTLSQDIEQASIALGLFSGALVSASAAGLPGLFLRNSDSIELPELQSFASQKVSPDQAVDLIKDLINSEEAYQLLSEKSRMTGRAFFNHIDHSEISPRFTDELLSVMDLGT